MLRLATAAVLAPLLWVMIKLAPGWGFSIFAMVCIILAAWETFHLLEGRGARPFKLLGVLATIAVAWSFLGMQPRFATFIPIIGVTIVAFIASMWWRSDANQMFEASVSTIFPVIFVGLTLSYLLALHRLPNEDGEDLVLLLFWCVICSDTAAYYFGKRFGRHRLAPRLSPKKSWEGAVAGMAASVVAALIAQMWFYQRLPVGHAIVLGLVLSLAGIFGDLAESMLKRAAGAKDSSGLLPGHGGVLDRVDGLLFAGPILYHYYVILLQGNA